VRGLGVFLGGALALAGAASAQGAVPPRGETAAAREQARLCEQLSREAGLRACRSARELGLSPERRGPVREKLAKYLVTLERWDELAELFRESVSLEPEDAASWQRLGWTLLFALNQPAEAVAALEQAARLAPKDASARLGLALALQGSGRPGEAVAAFEEAQRLDPAALEGRPAAQAALVAARNGESWP
jgi:tetratricopeptide (TPR) repeat protein